MIVQADLPHRYNFWMLQQVAQMGKGIGLHFRRIVGMHAAARIDKWILICQPDGCFQIGWAVTSSDSQHEFQSGCTCAFDDRLAILRKLPVIQMTM